jgi:hypothetical protein
MPRNALRITAIAIAALFLGVFLLKSCRTDNGGGVVPPVPKQQPQPAVKVPAFDSDSAFAYVKKQVDFGPRNPGSAGHKSCGDWMVAFLQPLADTVIQQNGTVTAFNGQKLPLRNIIASWAPEKKDRILLMAHWDTRPFADKDTERKNEPILGANDGGSGVGVLLEIARRLKEQSPALGVDIFLTDVEDFGEPSEGMGTEANSLLTWCLGSQYWAKNPHVPNYTARFGILLDMCGTADATFYREQLSMQYAPHIVQKVWTAAAAQGYERYFKPRTEHFVGIDDHVIINRDMRIPTIDIIAFDESTKAFHSSWHTHKDDLSVIDRATLQAVGATVLHVVYQER